MPLSLCSTTLIHRLLFVLFFNDTAPTEIYTLSLHDALPIWGRPRSRRSPDRRRRATSRAPRRRRRWRSEEHTSELQSLRHLVCRLLLEKKKITNNKRDRHRLT